LGELGIVLEDATDRPKIVWKRVPGVEPLDNLLAEMGITLEDTPQKDS